jgi:hypothetical protein
MKKQPFFARFLENQISERETAGLKAGCLPDDLHSTTTRKAPSDWEDDCPLLNPRELIGTATHKAPSDNED